MTWAKACFNLRFSIADSRLPRRGQRHLHTALHDCTDGAAMCESAVLLYTPQCVMRRRAILHARDSVETVDFRLNQRVTFNRQLKIDNRQ
jgi:hypothetical protein